MSREQLGPNMRKILEILGDYKELTIIEIAELLYGTPVQCNTKEYYSTSRSLRDLKKRGLVKRKGGRVLWSKTK